MDSRSHTHVTAALRLCLHALLAGLLALVVVRAVGEGGPRTTAVVAVALLTAALYAAGGAGLLRTPGGRGGGIDTPGGRGGGIGLRRVSRTRGGCVGLRRAP